MMKFVVECGGCCYWKSEEEEAIQFAHKLARENPNAPVQVKRIYTPVIYEVELVTREQLTVRKDQRSTSSRL